MRNINRVVLSGRLTREPELRQTAGGFSVLSFGIAVNGSKKNQQGEWEDVPNFFDCSVVGSRASGLSQYLHKGMKVALEGELRYSSWTAQDGTKRSKVEVSVGELEFMDAKSKQQDEQQQPAHEQQPAHGVYDEDIPF